MERLGLKGEYEKQCEQAATTRLKNENSDAAGFHWTLKLHMRAREEGNYEMQKVKPTNIRAPAEVASRLGAGPSCILVAFIPFIQPTLSLLHR